MDYRVRIRFRVRGPKLPVANFLQYICSKNYENWLAVDKVIAKIIRLTFLAHPVMCSGVNSFTSNLVTFLTFLTLLVYRQRRQVGHITAQSRR